MLDNKYSSLFKNASLKQGYDSLYIKAKVVIKMLNKCLKSMI